MISEEKKKEWNEKIRFKVFPKWRFQPQTKLPRLLKPKADQDSQIINLV